MSILYQHELWDDPAQEEKDELSVLKGLFLRVKLLQAPLETDNNSLVFRLIC